MNFVKIFSLRLKTKILIIFFLFFNYNSYSEDVDSVKKEYPKIGSVLNVSYNFSFADIRLLPSIKDSIPRFAFGENYGMILGVYYEHPFNNKYALMFQGLYSVHFADIYTNLASSIILNNQTYNFASRHKLSTDLTSLLFEPLLKVLLVDKLSFLGGFNIGLRFERIVEHEETIISPEGFTFPDGFKTRNHDNNLIPIDGFRAALVAGLIYDIPIDINEKFIVSPQFTFSYGFSDVAKNFSWDVNSLRTGLVLKYVPLSEKKSKPKPEFQIENIELIDTIKIRLPDIENNIFVEGKINNYLDTIIVGNIKKISAVALKVDTLFIPDTLKKKKIEDEPLSVWVSSESSGIFPISEIRIEDFLSIIVQPLLNYVFFYENSAEIPNRYIKYTKEKLNKFNFKDLTNKPTLEVYNNILNILGWRLKNKPKSKITLTGCNAGKDFEDPSISEKRANAVKNYLVDVWEIDPRRIQVKYRNLPLKSSTLNDTDGVAENRRVEITSDDWDLVAPLFLSDTLRFVSPLFLKFNIDYKKRSNIEKWSVSIFNDDKVIKKFEGNGKLPDTILWEMNERQDVINDIKKGFYFQVEAVDKNNKIIRSNVENINVDHITVYKKLLIQEGDKRIDRYSLILFDFNAANLGTTNSKIMDYINSNINDNSTVLVEGFTDRVGDEDYNLELSKRRALTVWKLINAKIKSYMGFGESNLLYDNNLPEGRFYSRTVRVNVETPIMNNFEFK
ncbi:MAG: OmpA family protein [Candidatus Kapabacteria bacterium]|nr:OmpA family protein [Candidatus Kapabacteria bacterium]